MAERDGGRDPSADTYTIGLDYGTSSVRAVVVSCEDGRTVGTRVFDYPSGERGVIVDASDPHLARQNPADYVEGLRVATLGALAEAEGAGSSAAGGGSSAEDPGFFRDRVVGIGVDTTGSTPIPVDAACRPLALDPKWRANPAAHAWLWKDHTSAEEAANITESARAHAPEYLAPIGGTYSSEWFWSKVWHCLNVAPDVFAAAASWVELADFVPAVLAGASDPRIIFRCVCAAGHKAMYSPEWGGLPSREFLARLDPRLAALRDRLYEVAHPPHRPAGRLSAPWAEELGLRAGIPIAMGGFDAHYGAVGAGVAPGTLVKIIGTSTCDITIAPNTAPLGEVPGICGIVDGSVMTGYYGIEAGQSAVGDLLHWWIDSVCEGDDTLHATLSDEAASLRPGASGLLALDWNNGNRTVLVDPRLTGLVLGQTLGTTRAEVYRALIESTAFGARVIVERLEDCGIPIDRIVCCGGIAAKNDLFMQIYADVLGRPMLLAGSRQTPALGAAISAAVAAGAGHGGYASFEDAQARMTSLRDERFDPEPGARATYDDLYAMYRELHDSFGGVDAAAADFPTLMKRLLGLRERVAAAERRGRRPMTPLQPAADSSAGRPSSRAGTRP